MKKLRILNRKHGLCVYAASVLGQAMANAMPYTRIFQISLLYDDVTISSLCGERERDSYGFFGKPLCALAFLNVRTDECH